MNDVADTTLSQAGLRNQTRERDAQSVNTLEVRFTDPSAFLACLDEDAGMGAIADSIVWLARTSGEATVDKVMPERAWDKRPSPAFRSMYVECSYLARGQLHKGSFYCGVALVDTNRNPEDGRTVDTALRLLDLERRMQLAVGRASREHKLTIRGGGAMHLFDVDAPWQAHPDHTIEAVPRIVCRHCGEEIYHANEAWRHKSTGRETATKAGTGTRGRPIQMFDHNATPAEASS